MMDEINASKVYGIIIIFLSSLMGVLFIHCKIAQNFSQNEYLTKLIFMFEFKLGMCVQNLRSCPTCLRH